MKVVKNLENSYSVCFYDKVFLKNIKPGMTIDYYYNYIL